MRLHLLPACAVLLAATAAAAEHRLLDLSTVANRGLADAVASDGLGGWSDEGDNDLRGLKPGMRAIDGIPFNVLDPAAHGDRVVLALAPRGRTGFAGAAEIPLGGLCAQVALLHAAAWTRAGEAVGTVAFRYADGGLSEPLPVTAGEQIGDWYSSDALTAAASRAQRDACPRQSPVFLACAAFANPQPERPLRAVVLAVAAPVATERPGPRWLVLAATASDAACLPVALHRRQIDTTGWTPFATRPATAAQPLLDCSGLLDAPAGRHGFLAVQDGRFRFADGTPARFFGTNIHAHPALFPSHAQAEAAAATFARLGLNLVRIHLAESKLIDVTRADRQTFIPASDWERLDYLLKCLKERGIYVQLCSVTGLSTRILGEADGIGPGYRGARSWLYWIERLDQLGRRYAAGLVAHVNPHTGLAYGDDPGIALMMLVNEQTALADWKQGLGTPEAYRRRLGELFGAWLQRRHPDRAALATAWGDLAADEDPATGSVQPAALFRQRGPGWRDAASPARQADTLAFLVEVQRTWSQGMAAHLRSLGVRVPLAVTNLTYTPSDADASSCLDWAAQNAYYDHPRVDGEGHCRFDNRPLAARDPLADDGAMESWVAAAAIAGKPILATETDTQYPHEWRSGSLLSLAATAAHQDWDGFLQYAYVGGGWYGWDEIGGSLEVLAGTVEANDPATTGLFPAAALLFHRRDVAVSPNEVRVVYGAAEARSAHPFDQYDRDRRFPFSYLARVCRVRSAFSPPAVGAVAAVVGDAAGWEGPALAWSRLAAGDPVGLATRLDGLLKQRGLVAAGRGLQEQALVSDTGEIRNDWGHGLTTVNTARTQGFTGFPVGPVRLGSVEVTVAADFATVVVSSLDGLPITGSRRLLVTAVGRAMNERDAWAFAEPVAGPGRAQRGERVLVDLGKRYQGGRVLIEPLGARVALTAPAATVTALASDLGAAGEARRFTAEADGRSLLDLGRLPGSVWYLVEVER